jgi:hypothetical protein
MFRIEFFVDERRLGKALIALLGLAHGLPSVTPVVNAEKKGNGLVAKVKGGSSLDRFAAEIKQFKGKTVVTRDLAPIMTAIGLAPKSAGYIVAEAVKAHLLKRHGKGSSTSYTVL